MSEKWTPAVGYEGIYEASDAGRIRSARTMTNTFQGKILSSVPNSRDYQQVSLYKNGTKKSIRVHRIIMESFIGPRPDGKQINHIDGDRKNNRLDNLEYVTQSENMLHAYRIGLQLPVWGEAHGQGKLTEENVHEIRRLILEGMPQRLIAIRFNVCQQMISMIATKKRWHYLKEEDDITED